MAQSLEEANSAIGYHPRTQYNVRNYVPSRGTVKLVSLHGDIVYAPKEIRNVDDHDWKQRVFPGTCWLIKETENGPVQVPTLPFITELFLHGNLLYDGTGRKLQQVVIDSVWKKVTRAILYYNNLYDENGIPKEEAYDPEYILRLFIRREWFDALTSDRIVTKYFDQLNEVVIKAMGLLDRRDRMN